MQNDDSKQAISLTDIVNDDSSSVPDTSSGGLMALATSAMRRRGEEGFSSNTASQLDDETDTDDELGEVAFDQNDFKFDFEKQEKDANTSVSTATTTSLGTRSFESSTKDTLSQNDKNLKTETDTTTRKPMDIFEERASVESKRNNLKKDLKVINEIASTARPNRYKVAPIWAQKWKPTVKALQSVVTKDLLNIDVSFTQVIPDDDLTKSVQDWIYATVLSIPQDQRQYVELEMKFGILMDRGSDSRRVSPPVSSQTVYTEQDATMRPDVDERVFHELNRYVKGISELNENTGKFNIIDSHTRDDLYRVGVSTQRPRFLRMSRDVKTGRIGAFIEKKRISQILLFSPKDSYDVKISVNVELPVPDNDPPEKYKNQPPISSRTKERTSYIHNDSFTRIDITKVANHGKNSRKNDSEFTYEIELELNTQALLASFDKIAQDSKTYASIVRTFLNNGTIIRRKLTSISYEIFEGSKKL